MEHAFGTSAPLTLGIEEELLLVDPRTQRARADVAERVLGCVELPETLAAHEAFAVRDRAAHADLPQRRRGGAGARARPRRGARAPGATLMGAGLHPAANGATCGSTDKERYRTLDETMRGLIRRTPECALHVHVGMPDPEAAIRVAQRAAARTCRCCQALGAN